jgi:hypothetical protein
MRTQMSVLRCLAALLAIAAQGSLSGPVLAQNPVGTSVPVVSIEATGPIAEESSDPYDRLALRGRFTITRTGSLSNALTVFVHYSGTTTAGVDYPFEPWLVTIPAGSSRIDIDVVPTPDDQAEPLETVEATPSGCPPLTDPPMGIPCHLVNIDPAHASARVFVRDDGITAASLEMTAPEDGAELGEGRPVSIAATAIDLGGAITHVDFFDGERKIGESSIFFLREPEPGTPVFHEFEWRDAAVGPHLLTARALNAAGNAVKSPPVRILVGGGPPVVSIEASVPETHEPLCPPNTCLAPTPAPGVFLISRRGGDMTRALTVLLHYGGSALPGRDYTPLAEWVEIPAGQASVEFDVTALFDDLAEGDESVVVALQPDPSMGPMERYRVDPAQAVARIVIHDRAPPMLPVVTILATDSFAREGANSSAGPNTATFVVSRVGATDDPLDVPFSVGGTASNGVDYAAITSPVTIPAGQLSARIVIRPLDDNRPEPVETVMVTLLEKDAGVPGDILGQPHRATAIIVDDDGRRDMLWRHATRGDVWLWPMNGAAPTAETYVRTVADTNREIRGQGDFTGDGQADILWRHRTTGEIYLWPMDGSTPLSETYVGTVDPVYDIVGTGDFNGDGKSDILWRHLTNGEVWIWLMDGATPLSRVYMGTVDPAYAIKGGGDLDGDGKTDIVWHHATAGEVWVWLMDGATPLSRTWVTTVPDVGYQIAGVVDFGGDGKADILWHHATRGEVWLWRMDGATRLAETWAGTVPDTNYRIVNTGDYDGDGKADILWHHATAGEVWVWRMDGATRLSQSWVGSVPDLGYQIVKVK